MNLWPRLTTVAFVTVLLVAPSAGAFQPGFMTGSGSVTTDDGTMVVGHHFELHCEFPGGTDVDDPNTLVITWGGEKWTLETLTKAGCEDRNRFDQRPPAAAFDTYNGEGEGECSKDPGPAYAKWEFTDQGEPGSKDTAWIRVECPNSVIEVRGKLEAGNHQAHNAHP